jgi:hypothetical protein
VTIFSVALNVVLFSVIRAVIGIVGTRAFQGEIVWRNVAIVMIIGVVVGFIEVMRKK